MGMVGGGQQDMMPLLLQMLAQQRDSRLAKAKNYLSTVKPGEPLGKAGAKAFKRATGEKGDPTKVLIDQTLEGIMDKEGVATWSALPPEQRITALKNIILNKATGTTGPQSEKSYAAGQAAETNIQTHRAGVTGDALAVYHGKDAPPGAAGTANVQAGEKISLGAPVAQTAADVRAAEATASGLETELPAKAAEAETRVMMADRAQKFLADPKNSAWGQYLKKHQLDPEAVTTAFLMGHGSVLNEYLQRETVLAGNKGDIAAELAKAEIRSAEDFSTKLGGKLTPKAVLALRGAVDLGQDPFKVSGVSPDGVHLWQRGEEIQSGAYLRERIAQNNPGDEYLKSVVQNMKDAKGDATYLKVLNEHAALVSAQKLAEGDVGPRPGPEDAEGQALFDRRTAYHYRIMAMSGKDVQTILGVDWVNQDEYKMTNEPGWMKSPSDTTAKQGTIKPVSAEPAVKNGLPTFGDPSSADAAAAAVNWLRDPSLFKGGTKK